MNARVPATVVERPSHASWPKLLEACPVGVCRFCAKLGTIGDENHLPCLDRLRSGEIPAFTNHER